jgi:hypothetical protein
MIEKIDLGKETFTTPSVIKDPFKFDKIHSIIIYSRVNYFGSGWHHSGTVEFKNGSTEGKQKFESDSLDELIVLIRNFVIELNNMHI